MYVTSSSSSSVILLSTTRDVGCDDTTNAVLLISMNLRWTNEARDDESDPAWWSIAFAYHGYPVTEERKYVIYSLACLIMKQ